MKRDHYFSNAQYFELIWSKTVLIVSILNTKRSDICDFSPFVATQQKKKCICHHLLHFNLTGLHCKSTNTSIILSTSPSPSHNAESSICCWSFVRDWSSSQHCSSEKKHKTKQNLSHRPPLVEAVCLRKICQAVADIRGAIIDSAADLMFLVFSSHFKRNR